jgi:hypothetical protein
MQRFSGEIVEYAGHVHDIETSFGGKAKVVWSFFFSQVANDP